MKRSTATLALIAGLLMTLFGATAYADPCPPAPGYTDSSMSTDMNKPTFIDRSSWFDELAN
ncbi:MAG: hypothetical protein KJ914_08725 [Gammaproteobacteria bacterium]|nr:hypothetical protein [Gammaproteobacteria bacterium]MBU1723079.1 hypothetical protein [Gammaproteobacteria bacterium]MBU2004149.1 hypothetical protein [Gammaproteobacteria bacterium]